MILARVVANIVATQKNKHLVGKKLLLLQPVDMDGKPAGNEVLAVDADCAGTGDLVVAIAEGGSARIVAKAESPLAPIDVAIAGIVDIVESEGKTLSLYDMNKDT